MEGISLDERNGPDRSHRAKYLSKMEDFLKSLRDLEEDLEEALTDLERYGPSGTGTPGSPAPRLLSQDRLNQFGWRVPERKGAPEAPDELGPEDSAADDGSGGDDPDGYSDSDTPDDSSDSDPCSGSNSGLSCTGSGRSGSEGSSGADCFPEHHRFPCPPPPPPPHRLCGTQVIVNGTLTVPEVKPDIEMILRFMPVCKVTDWQCVHTIEGRKIVVTGLVEIGVEYVADAPDQPVHFVHFVVPFHAFFLCERPLKGVTCEVEFKHAELLNPRTISKVILLLARGIEG